MRLQVYASGPNVIVLTKQLEWVQTLSSVSFGFPSVRTNCVHCAELGGKVLLHRKSDHVGYDMFTDCSRLG